MKSLYLGRMGNQLPNRACTEKGQIIQKQLCQAVLDDVNMVRDILPEVQFPLLSSEEEHPDCVGVLLSCCIEGFEVYAKETRWLSCIKNTIKEMSEQPKFTICINNGTAGGLRREISSRKTKAYRGPLVAVPRRVGGYVSLKGERKRSGSTLLQFRGLSTATGSRTNVLKKLDDLRNYSKKHPYRKIDRDLYKTFLLNPILFLAAYQKLRSKPGSMTPGINPTTLDGMSLEEILKIIDSLRDESFKFTPGRVHRIPKSSGGTRLLVLGNPKDKLVQEVMRMVLEAIFEPIFHDNSHGFRPDRSCHSALRFVFTKFVGTTWWIEGDIHKCFYSIPQDKLMILLENKITDQRFLQLIRKSLNTGYFDFKIYVTDIIGTPQGSVISPILANIFLDQLDSFILDLKDSFDSKRKNKNLKSSEYWQANYQFKKSKKAGIRGKELRKLAVALRSTQAKVADSRTQRFEYVRYADDWIIAVNGSRKQAVEILEKVTKYCASIGLVVSPDKTKITNSYKKKILFLGTNIRHALHQTYSLHLGGVLQRNRRALLLTAPINLIKRRFSKVKLAVNNRGVSRTSWVALTLRQIIHNFNRIIQGYENYYSFIHNKGNFMSWLFYVLRDSALRTIAHKLSLGRRAKVVKRFGINLHIPVQVKDPDTDKIIKREIKLYKPSFKLNVWDFKSKPINTSIPQMLYSEGISLATLDNLICTVCRSNYRVEMHHVRMMKNLSPRIKSLDALMAKANRKQIPLCRNCHMKYHNSTLIIPKIPNNDSEV